MNCRLTLMLGSIVLVGWLPGGAHAQQPERAPDTMAARMLACTPCHGSLGQGTHDDYFPRLAGKPSGYLYNQLLAFREGRRRYPPMNYLLEFLHDDYLHEIADYFAAQRPPLVPHDPPTVSKDVMAHGKDLATKGDPKRSIPACVSCHGPSLTGMEPAIPGLIGLHARYIIAQLGAFRYGTRTAPSPDCMQIVTGHLTAEDANALAAWLSVQPVSPDPSPVPRGSLTMPLHCGSEPSG